jgi:hypothetical protein
MTGHLPAEKFDQASVAWYSDILDEAGWNTAQFSSYLHVALWGPFLKVPTPEHVGFVDLECPLRVGKHAYGSDRVTGQQRLPPVHLARMRPAALALPTCRRLQVPQQWW